MTRAAIKKDVLRNLAIRSKNKCAYPDCDRPLLNDDGVYIAELCHIEAAEPGGQRYNALQSDEDRRSEENLLFLCHEHHKVTDDETLFPAERLRDIKRSHEKLPEVIFNAELLLHRIDQVLAEQAQIKRILGVPAAANPPASYAIVGPELKDSWTPEDGRFYENKLGPVAKFKYMMRDGWLHIEQTLEDGAIAYYEINEAGSVRDSRFPYPMHEYRVVIPDELVVGRERVPSQHGTHAIRTVLKWSKGSVIEHFMGDQMTNFECSSRCQIDHKNRTIVVVN